MPERPKCFWCNKSIPKDKTFITIYYAPNQYIYFFCSLWELIKWYVFKKKDAKVKVREI